MNFLHCYQAVLCIKKLDYSRFSIAPRWLIGKNRGAWVHWPISASFIQCLLTNVSKLWQQTNNEVGISVALQELRKKVLAQKEKISNKKQPKKVDFSEFLDNKYASLKILDLMERHIVLLMSESKKIDALLKNRTRNKYRPNIDKVKKQLKVLQGIDLMDDKYLSSLNKDFILLKGDYSPRTINYMKKCN